MSADGIVSPGPVPRDHTIYLPLKRLRRWLFLGLVVGTTVTGVLVMLDIVRSNGISALEIAILLPFAGTFGWIAISFWNGIIGFVLQLLRRDPLSLDRVADRVVAYAPLRGRTAVVMPVCNEDPARIMSGLTATIQSQARTGHGDRFDVYLLSDTTDPSIALAEETAWRTLREKGDHPPQLYYRRRLANTGRKAGNIADFCQRWGGRYDFMVVLDADSIMSGATLVELVQKMEANPAAGLIQTVPIPGQEVTLFGRLVQFAARLYSTMLATGQSFWQTDSANYWGHNAIVRIRAFTDNCGLPVLPGRPPFGGDILSHDFVEAALLRRAGWQVYLLPTLDGSYEEVPGNLLDYATRDRRWSQGSLQHLRLMPAYGLHSMNRLHFLLGAMGYVASLLWLLILIGSTVYVVLPEISSSLIGVGSALFADWAPPRARPTISFLAVTGVMLLLPKFLGMFLAVIRHRRSFGGVGRLLLSGVLEIGFSVVVAPLLMMYHTRFVVSVLIGHDIRWDPQTRGDRAVSWREAAHKTVGITGVGLAWAAVTLYFSPAFFLWLSPIFVGLLLAAPLVRWTSSPGLGRWARRGGLFLVPTEVNPPPELRVVTWPLPEPTEPTAERHRNQPPAVPPEQRYLMPRQVLKRRRGLVDVKRS